jgi:hypothetical protein
MGMSGQRHTSATLHPLGKGPLVPVGQEVGSASELVWREARGKILCLCLIQKQVTNALHNPGIIWSTILLSQ